MKQLLLFCLFFNFTNIYAQWTIEKLSEPRTEIASFADNNKFFFVGGEDDFAGSRIADVYNAFTKTWEVMEVPTSAIDWQVVDAGDYVALVGGFGTLVGSMMIYDKKENTWRAEKEINNRFGAAVGGINNKLYFAGGKNGTSRLKVINVLDLGTNEWTVDSLSVPRSDATVINYGSKILFIGGEININFSELSTVVDVLDTENNTWESFNLSEEKYRVSAEVVGDKLILGGGQISNNLVSGFSNLIEVIDLTDYSGSTYPMSSKNGNMASVVIGDKVIFAGEKNPGIEIFDLSTDQVESLSFEGNDPFIVKGVSLGNKAFFTGLDRANLNMVFIYDVEKKEWSSYDMGIARRDHTMVAHQANVMVAGGNSGSEFFDEVHIFEDSSLTITTSLVDIEAPEITIYPNPVSSQLNIQAPQNWDFDTKLYDMKGRLINHARNKSTVDVNPFPNGLYYLEILNNKSNQKLSRSIVIEH